MNKIPIFCVDAFTSKPFSGNPAAVCLLEGAGDERWMQSVAAEMNLSEAAFLHKLGDAEYTLRWFTPTMEIDLCGHATLASAHALYERGDIARDKTITFRGTVHTLKASSTNDGIVLDFPLVKTSPADGSQELFEGLGVVSTEVFQAGDDLLVEVDDEETVQNLNPDLSSLAKVKTRGVIVTAKGNEDGVDFVSRFFAPGVGIDEDPVTGSAHCALADYWRGKLGKDNFFARQLSKRGGEMRVKIENNRALLSGKAITVWEGFLRAGQ